MPTHFWDEVTASEAEAKALIEKAQKGKEADLVSYKQKLEEDKAKAIEGEREKIKENLKEKQKAAKAHYTDLVKKGEGDAAKFEAEKSSSVKGQVEGAADYFFKDLMGIS